MSSVPPSSSPPPPDADDLDLDFDDDDTIPEPLASEDAPPKDSVEQIKFGCDLVTITGAEVSILSPRDMTDWVVRTYRPVRVFFRDEPYELKGRIHASNGWRYRLSPWASEDESFCDMFYDLDFVRDREKQALKAIAVESAGFMAWPVLAIVGFFPSSVKTKLRERWGVNDSQATVASLWVQGVTCFAMAVALLIQVFVPSLAIESLSKRGFLICVLVLGVDLVWRASLAMGGNVHGFYEWLWKRGPLAAREGNREAQRDELDPPIS